VFDHYAPVSERAIASRQNGVMISNGQGTVLGYSLFNLQERGRLMVAHGDEVYEGQIVGIHSRDNDLVVNPLKGKKLTNIRAAGRDENIVLTPPIRYTLEQAMEFIEDDELVEITPASIRLRKRSLKEHDRKRSGRVEEESKGDTLPRGECPLPRECPSCHRELRVRPLPIYGRPESLEFLGRLWGVHPRRPVRRKRDWGLGNQHSIERVTPACKAAPRPLFRACDEPRAQRVTLNVAHDCQQVPVLLDRKRLEAPLPDPARRSVLEMVAVDMCRQQPVHPSADVLCTVLGYHEVEVVRHDAERQHPQRDSLLSLLDQAQKRPVVRGREEYIRPIIATVDDVVVTGRNEGSKDAWHLLRMRLRAAMRTSRKARDPAITRSGATQ
jgi:hypothetical protein